MSLLRVHPGEPGAAGRSQRRSRLAAVRVVTAGADVARRVAAPVRRAAKADDAVAAAQKRSRELADRNVLLVERCAAAERAMAVVITQQLLAVDLISTVGYDGHFKSLNPAWERATGYTAEELMSRPFLDFLHPDDVESTMAQYAHLLETGADTVYFFNRYPTKAGGWRWLEWHVRPDPEHQLLYCVARDVTERMEADRELAVAKEQADTANLAKSEFLSRMSHELRTPLNAILGFGQLLEMDELEAPQRESVGQILGGGRHLLSLVDEVLDISRIETGSMRVLLEPVELMSALHDAVALIAPVAEEAGVMLNTELLAAADDHVLADRQRLRQVVLNLLSNAVKYSRRGDTVTVSSVWTADRVRITVSDTGPGIASEKLNRLFVAFDRLDAEETGVPGTGLGLALSKSLTELMGGTIFADSSPGHGSAFTITLQAASSPIHRPRLAEARDAGMLAEVVGARTILYIEDNPSNARLVEQAFASQPSVRVVPAMQGGAGLDFAKARLPDLILLDLHLPDMDGSVVLDRLQADPATAGIPVIVLSADATQAQVRDLLAAGALAYLTKPLEIPNFLAVVAEHLATPVTA